MVRVLLTPFLAIAVSILLGACASGGAAIPKDEIYQGQLAAALAPPVGAGWRTGDMQRQLQRGIDASGTFASVIALDSPAESNEAEVIIMPTVLEAQPGGSGLERVRLAVRTTRKSGGGKVGIDKVYSGRGSRSGDAVDDILKPLNRDLRRKYREPPVY